MFLTAKIRHHAKSLILSALLLVSPPRLYALETAAEQENSTASAKRPLPPLSAAHPTAQTLPQGIFRVTLPAAFSFGNSGFNASGTREKSGFTYERFATGVIIEYGLTPKFSIGVGLPIIAMQNLTINASEFKRSQIFQNNYNTQVNLVAQELLNEGLCATLASCVSLIKSNGHLGGLPPLHDTTTVLPTGELMVISQTKSIDDAIQQGVLRAATPAKGATGIGDLQIGFLWNLLDESSKLNSHLAVPLFFAWGLSLRLPTGKFDVISGYGSTTLPTGRLPTGGDATLVAGGGTYDGILRGNIDFKLYKGLYLSWQHQLEKSLSTAQVHRSSYLNPGSQNYANSCAFVPAADSTGDCQPNIQTFSRRGFRNVGFVEVQWGLGGTFPSLKLLGLYSQFKYNVAAANYLNGVALTPGRERFDAIASGIVLSGLPYLIPVEFGTEYEFPINGANRTVSPENLQFNLRVFGKF